MGMYSNLHHDFAKRTKANLEFIDNAYNSGTPNVYNVTQLINSLLGMVIFLKEGDFVPAIPLSDLCDMGEIEVIRDDNKSCANLKNFMCRFRNAIAHCRIQDFGTPQDIHGFIMHDQRRGHVPDWEIRITTQGIRSIAIGLVNYVIRNSPNQAAA
jgi:hypothetical protein